MKTFSFLYEMKCINEGDDSSRFLDKVWDKLLKLGVEESRIERAFSGKGAAVAIENYFNELQSGLKKTDFSSDKKITEVAEKLIKKYKKFFKV